MPPLIRRAQRSDQAEWLRMRRILIPDEEASHQDEIASYLNGSFDPAAVFVAESVPGTLAGFVEVASRSWAEGCASSPVAYIEAWYVEPDQRLKGVGRALFSAAEEWARQAGFQEIGSDAEIDNPGSISAHRTLGYEEVLRLVCFRRTLKPHTR